MRKFFLILSLCSLLFGESIFTLENTDNLKVYLANETDFMTQEQLVFIKKTAEEKLKAAGIQLNKTDASTFMVKIEAMEIEESFALIIHVGIGEEVITKRKGDVRTFAWTYYETDFIDTNKPYEDALESINYLINSFVESYHEDMEQ